MHCPSRYAVLLYVRKTTVLQMLLYSPPFMYCSFCLLSADLLLGQFLKSPSLINVPSRLRKVDLPRTESELWQESFALFILRQIPRTAGYTVFQERNVIDACFCRNHFILPSG